MKLQGDPESHPPRRVGLADELGKPHVQTAARRFRWRAFIHSAGRKLDSASNQPTVAWHLADCQTPGTLEAHCATGQQLVALDGNPDGHCLLDGVCPRCPEASGDAEPTAAAGAGPTAAAPSSDATEPTAEPASA